VNENEYLSEGAQTKLASFKAEQHELAAQLPVVFSDAQRDIVLMQTPPDEIKWRKGRGGQLVPYVEGGYCVQSLNYAFGFDWDFDIISTEYVQEIDEIITLGRLTVRANGHAVSKMQYGGAIVQRKTSDNSIVCLADDYKASATDCLKKCASALGWAHDVYRNTVGDPPSEVVAKLPGETVPKKRVVPAKKAVATGHWIDDDTTRKRFWAWARTDLGLTEQAVHDILGVQHIREYAGTKQDARRLIEAALDSIDFDADAASASGESEIPY